MRTVFAWLSLVGSWGIAIDSAARATWNWAKLGSFGYHVPWLLVALVCAAGVAALALMNNRRVPVVIGALLPTMLLLVVRQYP